MGRGSWKKLQDISQLIRMLIVGKMKQKSMDKKEGVSKNRHVEAITLNKGEERKKCSFKDNSEVPRVVMQLKPISIPRIEGGNVVVEVDEDDYRKGVMELQFSVVGRLFIQKGEIAPTMLELKTKLQNAWGINNLKVIPLDRCVFHVLLRCMENQSLAMTFGTMYTKPGVLRISQWYLGFNPKNHILTTVQQWVKVFGLPLEYRKEHNLLNIARRVGFPLKIDPQATSLYQGIFARVLLEIDLAQQIPDKIFVQWKRKDNTVEEEFFANVVYENRPSFV